ncbi:MAG: TonB-dependent receptor plug domain-containing protein [Rhodospirillaceae bacterium]
MAQILKSSTYIVLIPFVLTFALLCAVKPGQAQSQTKLPVAASQEEAGITIYEPNFFSDYRPTHAKDMLERIPGAAGALSSSRGNLAGDQDRRGLRSQTTQILINGKRLTTKGNSIQEFFERIPASQVTRIEVISGNVREIDSDIGSRVINVVLAENNRIGGTWSVGDVSFTDGQNELIYAGSISGETGAWSYTLSSEMRPRQLPSLKVERFSDSMQRPFRESIETRRMESRRYVGRGRIAYAFDSNHQAQINGFIEKRPIGLWTDTEFITDISEEAIESDGGGNFLSLTGEDSAYEISGDYTVGLTQKLSFKGLFVYSVEEKTRSNEDFTFVTDPTILLPVGGDSIDQKATEEIVRGTLDWAITQNQSIELGIEGAVNSLDKSLIFFSTLNGSKTTLPVFNADQVVTEDRVEAFSSHIWRLSPKWEIETGVATEFSWLDQLGSDVNTSRTFTFTKPSLDIWYNATDSTQFFISFRRDIGQLDFVDFISNLDREDDEIDAGNPELKPEKSWDAEIGVEHRLAKQAGVANLRFFYRDVTDVSDKVLFGFNQSAPGNLGAGKHYGVELETSLQLRQLGLIDAVLSSKILWQDSKVNDPFTLLNRRFAKQNRFKLNIDGRHDVQAWGISYGTIFAWNGPTIQSDFNTFEDQSTGPDMRLFMEKPFPNGIVGRLFWGNVIRAKNKRTKLVYLSAQADNILDRVESRRSKQGRFFGFSVRGNF